MLIWLRMKLSATSNSGIKLLIRTIIFGLAWSFFIADTCACHVAFNRECLSHVGYGRVAVRILVWKIYLLSWERVYQCLCADLRLNIHVHNRRTKLYTPSGKALTVIAQNHLINQNLGEKIDTKWNDQPTGRPTTVAAVVQLTMVIVPLRPGGHRVNSTRLYCCCANSSTTSCVLVGA